MPLEFPRLAGSVAFDCETYDPDIETRGPGWAFKDGGRVVGFSIAWGPAGRFRHYYPIAHEGGGNYPREKCLAWLKEQMARTDLTWIMYNRLYDEGWLRRLGIPVRGKVLDAYTAVPLLDEYRYSYKLDDVAKSYLGVGKDETKLREYAKRMGIRKLKDIKAHLWRFPADIVRPYAEQDAGVTLQLWEHVEPMLREQELSRVFQLETDLLPILLEMRWRGIPVDLDRAEQAVKQYRVEEAELSRQMKAMVGFDVEVWANDSLEAAYKKMGIDLNRTKTGKASITKPWLKEQIDPLSELVARVRTLNKTRTTFLEGYILDKHEDGRVHPEHNPLPSEEGGAVTGRFSVSNPNMNNLPNLDRDPVNGRLVRGCMLPEDGEEWAAIDYSQQEPRWMVHWAEEMGARGAEKMGDAYRANPDLDSHSFMAELTGLPRSQAKQILLGRAYGLGGASYCQKVGLPIKIVVMPDGSVRKYAGEEGQSQLDQFDEYAPFIRILSKECERRAKRRGYIKTYSGRRCRFGHTGGRDYYYKAMNRLVQGSSADQIKQAMVDAWAAGYVAKVTVYDELGFSVADRKQAQECAEIMKAATPIRVPMKVDIDMGPSWGDAVKVAA